MQAAIEPERVRSRVEFPCVGDERHHRQFEALEDAQNFQDVVFSFEFVLRRVFPKYTRQSVRAPEAVHRAEPARGGGKRRVEGTLINRRRCELCQNDCFIRRIDRAV